MKIAVLISGGVDSSVALKLLKEQGHDVTAYYLKIWLEDELEFLGDCPWEDDLSYVRQICEKDDIPLKIVPLQKEYFQTVVKYTISEVKAGRTPNPDVMCNNNIKFGLFFDKINIKKYDKVATGHYAQIIEKNKRFFLKKTPDPIKDQTYFLSNLKQSQLKKLIFPIGHLAKNEVRKLAQKFDLPNKSRKDSQGICFLGKVKYSEFIRHYLGEKKGDIINFDTKEKMGEHEGFWYYTIGQRKGIGIGGIKDSTGKPFYVVDKDSKKNIIYVSNKYHDQKRDTLEVSNFNWFAGTPPIADPAEAVAKKTLNVKLRHGEHEYKAKISFPSKSRAKLKLDSPDQGIAAGQFVAFYDGNICLGSAVISK
ncbi:MAG: tRNA 2-thiouridine(34) synthase MnmA [Nitrospirae bacterium]|nr:tRNA 2-thiouridine(34) synthase MnmA [Nitrospirota bacterium]